MLSFNFLVQIVRIHEIAKLHKNGKIMTLEKFSLFIRLATLKNKVIKRKNWLVISFLNSQERIVSIFKKGYYSCNIDILIFIPLKNVYYF